MVAASRKKQTRDPHHEALPRSLWLQRNLTPQSTLFSPTPAGPALWTMTADGSNQQTVVKEGLFWQISFDWAPDGSRIVYSTGNLNVSEPDGSRPLRISEEGEYGSSPRWSPDGQWIAYTGYVSATFSYALRLASPDGSTHRTLSPGKVQGTAWSPDSSHLSYVRGGGNGAAGSLFVFDVNSGVESAIAHGLSPYSWTAWSPDGAWIAFQASDGDVHVVHPDGSNEVTVSGGVGAISEASWSPDAARILFVGGDGVIYVTNPDGSNRRAVGLGRDPRWFDASTFTFTRSGDIFSMSADGVSELQLTNEELRTDARPLPSPDGQTILFVGTRVQVFCPGFPWPMDATIVGSTGDDAALTGTDGPDVIAGRGGNDMIDGGGGNDIICGGDGSDVLSGGEGDDDLFGESGSDRIGADGGNDKLDGGSGADVLSGGAGNDLVLHLWIWESLHIDLDRGLVRGVGRDRLDGIERAAGSTQDDVIIGNDGANELHGSHPWLEESGDDVLVGRGGRDHLFGYDGDDLVVGRAGRDVLIGERGSDVLRAGRGNDYLNGGAHPQGGRNRLYGGGGRDYCRHGERSSCERP